MPDRRSALECADHDRGVRTLKRAALALAMAITACAPSGGGCNAAVSQTIAFAGADAVIRAETLGPNCHQAIALYTIRDAQGEVLWSWTAPLQRAFGDVFAEHPDEHLQDFLDRWAQPEIATTQSAPAWETLLVSQTSLDQLTYADIRARDLPMLCHYSATGRQTCVFWEPAAGGAGHLYDRDASDQQSAEVPP